MSAGNDFEAGVEETHFQEVCPVYFLIFLVRQMNFSYFGEVGLI